MANIKFTEFPSATVVGSMDIIPIVQDGANKKTTASVFSTYIGTLFVNLSGTQTITGSKTFSSQLISSVATGTAPFSVASTTKVTNLNADLLDGLSSAAFQTVLTNPITGTGTTNYLPKFTGASALGNSVIYQGGSNIGIGETNPISYPLQVKGADGQGIQYEDANGVRTLLGSYLSKAIIGTLTNHAVGFWSNNSEKITLTSAGNVGIGLTNPNGKLTVREVDTNWELNTSADGVQQLAYNRTTSAYKYMEFRGSDFRFSPSDVEKVRITNGGSILVNTTTDAGYKLDVNGTARVSDVLSLGSNTNYILFGTNATVNPYIQGGSDNSLFIGTGNASRLTISPTGAATFSSSVTANGTLTVNEDGASTKIITIRSNWAGVDPAINVTTNNSLLLMTNNTERMRITAAGNVTTVLDATINGVTVGRGAGNVASNTAVGASALNTNTTGSRNTANGVEALNRNTTGFNNSAFGDNSLYFNTTGGNNSAIGFGALNTLSTGSNNTALGAFALLANTASNNTAVGFESAYSNTSGTITAIGYQALRANTTGSNNVALGGVALNANTTGNFNTGIGTASLSANTTGSLNIGIGYNQQSGNFDNVAMIGIQDTATGSNQMRFGSSSFANGAVATEVNASSKVWNVFINGVAQKILLA